MPRLSVDADGHHVPSAATANSTWPCRLCGRGYYDLDPGQLGGQVTVLRLAIDIVSTTPMKQPINRALISIQRR